MYVGGFVASERSFPRTIILFGADGTGKTTQAKLLISYIRSHGGRPWWAWIRGRHSLAFVLALLFARFGYYQTVNLPNGTSQKVFDPRLLPKLRPIWQLIEFVSVLPWIILRVRLPRILGYTVVAERYVVDTVVYLGYWLGDRFLKSFSAKALLSEIPPNSQLIHLDAEAHVIFDRRQDDIITPDFVTYQKETYSRLARELHAVTINTSKNTIEQTFELILKALHNR